jgi:hypothetical protein
MVAFYIKIFFVLLFKLMASWMEIWINLELSSLVVIMIKIRLVSKD